MLRYFLLEGGGYKLPVHLLSFIIAQEGDTSQNYLPAFDVLSTNKSDCIFMKNEYFCRDFVKLIWYSLLIDTFNILCQCGL